MATDILKEQYNNLQEENSRFSQLISQQKDHLVSLEKKITVTESRIQEKLTVPGGLLKLEGKHSRHRKLIRILENKLNQDTIKFDKLLCSNMIYRTDIAHLLQQKSLWCHIDRKFNKELATQQNVTVKLGEKASLAFNQRSEAESRMMEVKKCIEVETVQFTKRRMQLKTAIAHDAKLQAFMETKFHEITNLEEDEDSKKRKKQQQYETEAKRLEMYKQGHHTLVEVTGETDLRQIAHMFIQNEQKNFAHVSYINELQKRRNMLKNCIDKKEIDIRFLEEENKRHNELIHSQLKDLEYELEMYSCLSESLEEQCMVVVRTLDQLMKATRGLCDQILQEPVSIRSDNITHIISMLEENVSNLLIQANNMDDEQTKLVPENVLLANSDLLPECETAVEPEGGRTPSRSLKSA
ncbi:coiled-coil domain-containing protein 63-like [Centropristis striata]|uniref:coiled-coil domain-containing protein 63-like n=1 Tax=Centropristis striata TaxID=184440 RepID=UPI0027DF9DCD|nr:coiled-coil domain-containing protein 63-like [Centropristis striata]